MTSHVVVVLWWCCGGVVVVLWWCYGGVVVVLGYWFDGGDLVECIIIGVIEKLLGKAFF